MGFSGPDMFAAGFEFTAEAIMQGIVAGAITGAVAGAISSAVYGGNWGNNIGAAAMGGAIGAGIGMTTRAILNSSFMKPTIEFLKEISSDLVAGSSQGAHVTYKTIGPDGKKMRYVEDFWNPQSYDDPNPFEAMLDTVIADNQQIYYFEFVGHSIDGDIFYGQKMLGDINFKDYKSKILLALAKNAKIELEGCHTYQSDGSGILHKFKALLPDSKVYGFTGKAKPVYLPYVGWEAHTFFNPSSAWVEAGSAKKYGF